MNLQNQFIQALEDQKRLTKAFFNGLTTFEQTLLEIKERKDEAWEESPHSDKELFHAEWMQSADAHLLTFIYEYNRNVLSGVSDIEEVGKIPELLRSLRFHRFLSDK